MEEGRIVDERFIAQIPSVEIGHYQRIVGNDGNLNKLIKSLADAVGESRRLILEAASGWKMTPETPAILPIRPLPVLYEEVIFTTRRAQALTYYNAPTYVGDRFVGQNEGVESFITSIELGSTLKIAAFMPDYSQCQAIISALEARRQK